MFGIWYGGSNYSFGTIESDLEVFSSKRAAQMEIQSRRFNGAFLRQHFKYADGRVVSTLTPTVDDSTELHLYKSDPRDAVDPYPDVILAIGPRGGVVERAA